jgi:hypothetical protein
VRPLIHLAWPALQNSLTFHRIVAVHGLGADPDYTWSYSTPANSTYRDQEPKTIEGDCSYNSRKIHLLRDLLCKDFPDARILSFAHNSMWLTDAPVKTTREIGKSLLEELKAQQPQRVLHTKTFV